mmetsp:Transcript_93687/g.303343  ORF Transcript_93687/g.303343 Transcript_93687/m.303343 type:complete len:240 (+) Transcript_93687:1373-2092(+)
MSRHPSLGCQNQHQSVVGELFNGLGHALGVGLPKFGFPRHKFLGFGSEALQQRVRQRCVPRRQRRGVHWRKLGVQRMRLPRPDEGQRHRSQQSRLVKGVEVWAQCQCLAPDAHGAAAFGVASGLPEGEHRAADVEGGDEAQALVEELLAALGDASADLVAHIAHVLEQWHTPTFRRWPIKPWLGNQCRPAKRLRGSQRSPRSEQEKRPCGPSSQAREHPGSHRIHPDWRRIRRAQRSLR